MFEFFNLGAQPPASDDFWYSSARQGTASGIPVDSDLALTYSAVWASTRVLSASGSVLPLSIFKRDGKSNEIQPLHSAHKLIHSMPNPEMGAMSLRSLGIQRQVNLGNFFCEILRDPTGAPIALWPLANDRVQAVRSKDGTLAWEIKMPGGDIRILKDADMFNVPSIISDNGIIGKGVIDNASETIGHALATVRQGAAYMKNSARPALAITGGNFKKPADRAYYRETFMDQHGGAEKNGLPAMLPPDADIKVLAFSPEASQFIQTMKHSVEDVARWYGVPPHMIQQLDNATFSNIEHQGIDFVVYSLIPWLKLWEEEIYRKLLTEKEQETHYAKHNVSALLRGDSAARAAYYQALWQLGAFSINEIRDLEEMNPIEGGEKHFVQTSYAPLDKIDEIIDAQNAPPPPPPPPPEPVQDKKVEDTLAALLGKDTSVNVHVDGPVIDHKVEQQDLTAMAKVLAEYTRPLATGLEAQILAVQEATEMMIEDAINRMLAREMTAIERALKKGSGDFFDTLDSFYEKHQGDLAKALSRPMHAHFTARGEFIDSDELASRVATIVLGEAKGSVLELTACQPDEWDGLAEKYLAEKDSIRKHRNEQVLALLLNQAKPIDQKADAESSKKLL